jgi:hypothetical protein
MRVQQGVDLALGTGRDRDNQKGQVDGSLAQSTHRMDQQRLTADLS